MKSKKKFLFVSSLFEIPPFDSEIDLLATRELKEMEPESQALFGTSRRKTKCKRK